MKADSGDFNQKYNRMVLEYQERIHMLFLKMVHNDEDADDLTQETFIKAYKNFSKFNGQSSFYTWLYRIAVNTGINHLRKAKIRQTIGLDSVGEIEDNNSPKNTKSFNPVLQQAIQKLPAKQHLVVLLRSFQELTFREISNIMNITENSAKVNYSHALNRLREDLNKMGVNYETL